MGARQDLDEGRLAGAVVTEERQHLARADVEIDAGERRQRAETLRQAARGEERGRGRIAHAVAVTHCSRFVHRVA